MDNSVRIERDRAATEKRLLDAIGNMIAEKGFEKIGINEVAKRSGVSKVLIYRYFGSLEELIASYIHQHDFWINFPRKTPHRNDLPDFIKKMFRKQIERLQRNPILKRLSRWELSTHNEMIDKLRQQREETGLWIVKTISLLTKCDQREAAALVAIISAAINYFIMLEDYCPEYIGIPLNKNDGWEHINNEIDILIDKWFDNQRCYHSVTSLVRSFISHIVCWIKTVNKYLCVRKH